MDKSELLLNTKKLIDYQPADNDIQNNSYYILVLQFFKNYVGKDSEFCNSLINYSNVYSNKFYNKRIAAVSALNSLKSYLELDLSLDIDIDYEIKIDIINDFISQAIELANNKKFHPAAASILLGATLEEFLKQLAVHKNIDLTDIKLTIDPITKKLYEEKIITKQDLKDITSWAGLRNDATHGNFEEVNDRKRVFNAIEGVNLFMRKYSGDI